MVRRRFLIALALVVCALLVAAVVVVVRRRRLEEEKRATTLARLEALAKLLREWDGGHERADGAGDDESGMHALVGELTDIEAAQPRPPSSMSPSWYVERDAIFQGFVSQRGEAVLMRNRCETLDAWGHPIRYRCPGPVHRHGWDLYSCGPDGIDDEGKGDDVLVGADLAPVTSGAH